MGTHSRSELPGGLMTPSPLHAIEGVQPIVHESGPNAEPFYRRQGVVVSGTHASLLTPERILHIMTVAIGETTL
jgi:hypothetical protein